MPLRGQQSAEAGGRAERGVTSKPSLGDHSLCLRLLLASDIKSKAEQLALGQDAEDFADLVARFVYIAQFGYFNGKCEMLFF